MSATHPLNLSLQSPRARLVGKMLELRYQLAISMNHDNDNFESVGHVRRARTTVGVMIAEAFRKLNEVEATLSALTDDEALAVLNRRLP